MREKILKSLANWHTVHPWRMLLVVLLITLILGMFAANLKITMRVSDLLPSRDEKVIQFNKILNEFTTATSLVVVVQGKEEQIKDFADKIAPQILQLKDSSKNVTFQKEIDKIHKNIQKLKTKGNRESKISELQSKAAELQARINMKLFQRVDYKAEVEFLKNHALMLVKEADLKNTKHIFMDPNLTGLLSNLNNSMEKEYVGHEESISTREKEDRTVTFLEGIQNLILKLQNAVQGHTFSNNEVHDSADKLLLGEPYMLSYDKQALILLAIPNFTLMDRDLLMVGTDKVQAIVDDMLMDYPDIEAGLSGDVAREHDEQVYAAQSFQYSTLIALFFILLLLIVSFRMLVAPVFAILNLTVGLIWGIGMAAIIVGQLNMMTSMMAVILLGLGIDFSIHLISGFTESRAAGDNISTAMEKTFLKSGKGILTGALTTACAFLALLISQSRGMKEMGMVIGIGLLSVLLATMLFLPVLLVFRERRLDKKYEEIKRERIQRDISFKSLGRMGEWLSKHYVFSIITGCILTFLLVWSAVKISFDQNYMNVEPEGLTSIALQDTILGKFDLSMEHALVLADNIEQSREFSKKYREMGSVAITNDISLYIPSSEEQLKRIPHIHEIHEKIQAVPIKQSVIQDDLAALSKEVKRLQMNIMEIQDMAFIGGRDKVDNKCKEIVGDPEKPGSQNIIRQLQQLLDASSAMASKGLSEFQQYFAPYFKDSIIKMCSTEPISLEELPVSILDRYCNKTRDQFLVTVFPSGKLWENPESLHRFVDDLESVTNKATGLPPVFRAILKIFARDGRNAVLLTILIVFLLLLMDFRSPRYAIMAMIPLACGVFWMVGFMHLIGMQINVVNIIGLPLIIGIGIDDGVHIMHRWKHEGKGKIRTIFSSTGKAIFLTSLTTMFAFGSLVFSIFRGWASFGGALFIGVGACFLTTVIILPGILGLIEKVSSEK